MASEAGQLQLNAFGRVIAVALLGSLKWLTAAMVTLRENCVNGISANRERLATRRRLSVEDPSAPRLSRPYGRPAAETDIRE